MVGVGAWRRWLVVAVGGGVRVYRTLNQSKPSPTRIGPGPSVFKRALPPQPVHTGSRVACALEIRVAI